MSHDDLSLGHGKLTNMSDDTSRSIASAVSQAVQSRKGLSTRLHRVSQSHQLARPLPQVLVDDLCVDVMNTKLIIEVCKFFQQSDW